MAGLETWEENALVDIDIRLPNGEILHGGRPVVLIGPNGSGKTRKVREMTRPNGGTIEFVNALRNTRVASQLPAMGQDDARNQFVSQRNQAQANHWDLSSEFDFMLSRLIGEHSDAAMRFTTRFRDDPGTAGVPEETALTRVGDLWKRVFVGRQLRWENWKPTIDSTTSGTQTTYSGNFMSDGEKAALYLAGRVFSTDPNVVLVVDEPETHFHPLLAIRLWDELEAARPDLRFVYITHDLTFAISRTDCTYVLASPTAGLRTVALGEGVPDDVAAALLGSASLSFYASRVVFCEGTDGSFDSRLFNAWFNGSDTVVRPVQARERVLRCVDALNHGGLAQSLTATGIVDRDYYSDAFFSALPSEVSVLPVHEVESLFVLPSVVKAVATHLSQKFSEADYVAKLKSSVPAEQQRQIVIQRWKVAVEPNLAGLVASTSKRDTTVDQLVTDMPNIFDYHSWSFSPEDILREEAARVSKAVDATTDALVFLALVPGKPLLPVAANQVGMTVSAYVDLIVNALRSVPSSDLPKEIDPAKPENSAIRLHDELVAALEPHLLPRQVASVGVSAELLTPE